MIDKYKFPIGKLITDRTMISEISKLNFDGDDVRPAWIGPGVPNHNNSALGNWAHAHLSMYLGFIYELLTTCFEENLSILDVGCGSGHSCITIADIFKNSNVVGIDNNSSCISFANKFNCAENVEYVCEDAIFFDYEKEFDLIFCLETFEHISPSNHKSFMDNCFEHLKQGGMMFFTTPNNSINEKDSNKGHIGMLNPKRAKEFFESYRNNIIDESYYDNKNLISLDMNDFIVKLPKEENIGLAKDLSHFRFVMKK
jgi:2-polyprenyl-3-methyl-5-hydroxy-6-metoxy-1,4-benzoquinol methylase